MILDAYQQDPETVALISDSALVAAMVEVEVALAQVQGRLGIIPNEAADRIATAAAALDVDIVALSAGTVGDGVPIIALLKQLRAAVGEPHADLVHWGATSQDIFDTALALMLRQVLTLFTARMDELIQIWAALAERHRGTVMAARTRSQQAVPTTFGLKVAGWIAPLLRHRQRLTALRDNALMLQLGGAGGTLAALGNDGAAVAEDLAAKLGLTLPPMPWHNQRDGIIDIANWLSIVSGTLGKTAGDILLLAQTEVSEVQIVGSGGSSAMPQKANPVLAEAVVTLARYNAAQISAMHQAAPHFQERDGAAWTLEWLTLPAMIMTTGAGLHHSINVAKNLDIDGPHMADNLAAGHGVALSEAAAYALARHMPKSEAQALVKAACQEATAARDLFDILANRTQAPIDWTALRNPKNYLGATDQFIDTILKDIPS